MPEIENIFNRWYNNPVLSREKGIHVGRVIGWFVVIILMVSMPGIFFGVLRDMLVITWAALPWYAQGGVIIIGGVLILLLGRVVLWALTGRSTLHRRNRY